MVDFLQGALRLPVATPPQPIVFPADSYWRGEMHHVCDRPELAGRLLDELIAAGAEQIVIVGSRARAGGARTACGPRPIDLRGTGRRVPAFGRDGRVR